MQFSADCPICKTKVHNAVLGHGSMENLHKDRGDVALAHATDDPRVGDHRWVVKDPQVKARLRKLITPPASSVDPDLCANPKCNHERGQHWDDVCHVEHCLCAHFVPPRRS